MKMVLSYLRKDVIYLMSMDSNVDGFGQANNHFYSIAESAGNEIIGAKIAKLLNQSREGVPTDNSSPKEDDAVLKNANVKSWTAFMRAVSLSCSIESEGDCIVFYPGKRVKGGGCEETGVNIKISNDTDYYAIGQALKKSFLLT